MSLASETKSVSTGASRGGGGRMNKKPTEFSQPDNYTVFYCAVYSIHTFLAFQELFGARLVPRADGSPSTLFCRIVVSFTIVTVPLSREWIRSRHREFLPLFQVLPFFFQVDCRLITTALLISGTAASASSGLKKKSCRQSSLVVRCRTVPAVKHLVKAIAAPPSCAALFSRIQILFTEPGSACVREGPIPPGEIAISEGRGSKEE